MRGDRDAGREEMGLRWKGRGMKTRHGHERSEETAETRDGRAEEKVTENAEARIQPM